MHKLLASGPVEDGDHHAFELEYHKQLGRVEKVEPRVTFFVGLRSGSHGESLSSFLEH